MRVAHHVRERTLCRFGAFQHDAAKFVIAAVDVFYIIESAGDITDGEMAAAREAILSGLRGVHDSPGGIEGFYASAALSGLAWAPEEYMERIAAVTAEQVAAAASTLKLHTTYILKGVEK